MTGIGDHRYEGVPLAEKFRWIDGTPGMANAEVVASNIRGMSEELAKMTEAVERVKKELGATWQGPAAQAAQASTSQTVQAAGRTQTLSENGAERIQDLGRSYEWLRRQVSFDDPAKYSGIQHIGDKLSEHLDHTNPLWHEIWQGGEDHITVAERNKQLDAQATAALYQHQRHAQETDGGFTLDAPDAPGGPGSNGGPGPEAGTPHVSQAAGGLDAMPAGTAPAPPTGSGSGGPAAGGAPTGTVGMAPGVGSAVPSGTAGGSRRRGAPPGGPNANGAGDRGAGGPGSGTGPGAGGGPGVGGGPGAGSGPAMAGRPGAGRGPGTGGGRGAGDGPGSGRPPMTTIPSTVGPYGAGPGRTGPDGVPSWGGTGAGPSPAEAARRQAELGRRFGQNLDSARLFPAPSPGPGRSAGWTGSGHSGWNSGTSRAPSIGGGGGAGAWGGGGSGTGGEPASRGWGGRSLLEPAPGRGEPGSGRAGFTEPAAPGRSSSSPAGGGPGPMMGGAGAGRNDEEHRNRYQVYSSQPYFEPDLPYADAVIQPCDEDEY